MDTGIIQAVYEMWLVGSSRLSFSDEQLRELEAMGMDTSLPKDELMLQCLVHFQQWEKAAQVFDLYLPENEKGGDSSPLA